MSRNFWISAALVAATLPVSVPAIAQQASPELQALDDQLPGTLIDDPTRLDWSLTGEAKKKTLKSADIPGGGAAVQVTVARKTANPWEVQLSIPLTAAIAPGDDVTIAFYARTIAANTPDDKAQVSLRFQQNSGAYDGFGDKTLAIGGEWQLYEVTGRANTAIAKGDGIVSLQLGGAAQTVAIGQAIVVKGATSITGAAAQTAAAAVPAKMELPAPLVGLGTIINDPENRDWGYNGESMTHESMDVGLPGGKATRFVVPTKLDNAWDAGVSIPIEQAIRNGETMRIAIVARQPVASTAPSELGVRVQRNVPEYEGFGDHQVPVGSDWQLIQLKTTADRDIPAGEAVVALHLGGAAQTLDIGPVWVIDTSSP